MYLLDTDVFIQAKNLHYGFDFCPAFWDWIDVQQEAGAVRSIEKVQEELVAGGDELADWAQARGSDLFLRPDDATLPSLRAASTWASGAGYDPGAVTHLPAGGRLLPRGPCTRDRRRRRDPRGAVRVDPEDQDPRRVHRPRGPLHHAVPDAPHRRRPVRVAARGLIAGALLYKFAPRRSPE